MTLDGYLNNNYHKVIQALKLSLEGLKKFKENPDKRLNISKLFNIYKITGSQTQDIISIFRGICELSKEDFFKEKELLTKEIKGEFFIALKKNRKEPQERKKKKEDNTITISKEQLEKFHTIYFKFMTPPSIGKGFDIANNTTDLNQSIKKLMISFPELFYKNGSDLIYISQLGRELGRVIQSYKNSNKKTEKIEINNTTILIR